jgi:predicted amidohydrolase
MSARTAQLTVALLQVVAEPDTEANLEKGLAFCGRAHDAGADIALFPEMWSIGYSFSADDAGRADLARGALDLDAPFVRRHADLAAELDMAIGVTFPQRWPGGPRNALALFDRQGELALLYAKVHTCDFDDEAALTPGEGFPVRELDTAAGPVQVGAMICFDVQFPESARVLMLHGAEIVLVPNACEMNDIRTTCLKTRAYENMMGVALANYAEPQEDGHSTAFSPVAYRAVGEPGEGAEVDPLIVRADGSEGVSLATFDLGAIRRFREVETQGAAYRKPRAYDGLLDTSVRPPFTRPDAR